MVGANRPFNLLVSLILSVAKVPKGYPCISRSSFRMVTLGEGAGMDGMSMAGNCCP